MIFYYVKTGHRFGLENFRRAIAIIELLKNHKITLLTSDYRIADQVQREFKIESYGIDAPANISQVANRDDILIYDSDEHSEDLLAEMIKYFSKFIRISTLENDFIYQVDNKTEFLINPYFENSKYSLQALPIREKFFTTHNKKYEKTLFFGDDDYKKYLLEIVKNSNFKDTNLILGFYYFLDYEDKLKNHFNQVFENEDYDEVIVNSKIVKTSSAQTALETLANGGKPIYIQRKDRFTNLNNFLQQFNIPILDLFSENYPTPKNYKPLNNSNKAIRFFLENIFK